MQADFLCSARRDVTNFGPHTRNSFKYTHRPSLDGLEGIKREAVGMATVLMNGRLEVLSYADSR